MYASLLILCMVVYLDIAEASYYCRAGNAVINVGDSIEKVAKSCGNPTQKKQSESEMRKRVVILQFFYATSPGGWQPNEPNQPGILIGFQDNIATEILNNGAPVKKINCPSSYPIAIGQSREAVYAACGKPDLNTTFQKYITVKKIKHITWTYQRGAYQSPVVIEFENDVVKNIGNK